MINYSFVIPHKNSPQDLERCINSIPEREDVQIIVVDDNSNVELRPKIRRSNVNIVYNHDSLGAGHVRNVGLKYVQGKWCIFADCDDFYEKDFLNVLDNYVDSNFDIVYFSSFFRVNLMTNRKQEFAYDSFLRQYNIKHSVGLFNSLKFATNAPWNKMYKSDFIFDNKLFFEEIPIGNDAFFVIKAASLTENICFLDDKLYYYVDNPSGITRKKARPITDMIAVFKSAARVDIIKAESEAWNLIRPFNIKRFCYYSRLYGVIPAMKLYCLKFGYDNYPFWKILYHKLIIKIKHEI